MHDKSQLTSQQSLVYVSPMQRCTTWSTRYTKCMHTWVSTIYLNNQLLEKCLYFTPNFHPCGLCFTLSQDRRTFIVSCRWCTITPILSFDGQRPRNCSVKVVHQIAPNFENYVTNTTPTAARLPSHVCICISNLAQFRTTIHIINHDINLTRSRCLIGVISITALHNTNRRVHSLSSLQIRVTHLGWELTTIRPR